MKRTAFVFGIACFSFGIAPAGRAGDAHWSYDGRDGPAGWAELDDGYATCKLGQFQSPIDIRDAKVTDLPPIRFAYRASPLALVDNGHTIQVDYAPGSSIEVGGSRYDLVQFHFHRPSEEKVDGVAHDMVVHLVHRSADGMLAVVAVLLDRGGANPVADTIFANLPAPHESASIETAIDATHLLPADKGYFTFTGSLTTPPCSEDVRWFVMKKPVRIAQGQIDAFGARFTMNARPTQPTNGRTIEATR